MRTLNEDLDFAYNATMRSVMVCSLFLLGAPAHLHGQSAPGLRIPPGFEVVEFADAKLTNDIHCLTIDPKGRIVVAGRGYIRILIDDDGNGKADRALDFASTPKDGAMGLLWEGDSLYAMGDGGLRRFTSKTGDKADGPATLIRAMKTGGEHAAHAIRRGPDGWLYVLCGNNTGIDKTYADLPTSPIKEPTAGCVVRLQPDLKKCEIVAHGFRNPYDMDFNLDGELFTFDSDNERCVSLPWYEHTRFYHVIEGRHYGWLNPQHASFWRRPPYFCDVVAPIATLGRGSPTGAACYRHNQFPPEYHGGFFLCDWTFGKIHFVKLERKGASYTATSSVFLEAQGDNGFAPSACAVEPKTGDLYVAIGGRGTRGAVYRIRHIERFKTLKNELGPLKMATRSLDWNDVTRKEYEAKLPSTSAADHLRALQIARRQGSFLTEPDVASPFGTRHYFDDLCVRQAYADLMDDLFRVAPPRYVEALKIVLKNNVQLSQTMSFGLGMLPHDRTVTLERGLFMLNRSKVAVRRLEGVRLIQLGLGDVGARKSLGTLWEGYSPRLDITDTATAKKLAPLFPSGDDNLDRELARTLGMLGQGDADLRRRILAKCTAVSDPIDDIHYLACFTRIAGKRDDKEAARVADTLLGLDRKIAARKLNRDSNWPLRVRELYAGLAEQDASLHQRMVEHPDFGRPDHALFANTDGFAKEKAAAIFLQRWQRDMGYALTGDIVQLLEKLPPEDVLPIVRQRWGAIGHADAFLPLLAKMPVTGDRGKFIAGLNSPQASVLDACVSGLTKLGVNSDADESFALIRALQRTTDKQSALRKTLAVRLEKTTGQTFGVDSNPWIVWLQKQHPALGQRLANPDGVDVGKWSRRLEKIDWSAGDAYAGKAVYVKANCVQCHTGAQAVGPDLVGIAKRFARADLFTAILQPSKDVPARYQLTVVETKEGKTYAGVVIYDAVDSLMLQSGAGTTVRLDGASVLGRYPSAQSLMPAGLLDALNDREIVDLYAYLRAL